ncbi:MAG: aquaporin Z [Lactobacillales bacterium]|nr:aquaporin Z [Lactobacillales bacterium]
MESKMKKFFAEFMGTFVLVLFGCGSAVLAGNHIGFLGVSIAFGIAVLAMAYAVGHISGGHFNPAVTLGVYSAGRMDGKNVIPYIIAQFFGAFIAATVLYTIVMGAKGMASTGDFAANVFRDYSECAAFLIELVMTFVFLVVILGVTSKNANSNFAPIAIGMALTGILLATIPVTNASINPARSTSQALFSADSLAMSQLWLFWVAPTLGGVLAGLVYRIFGKERVVPVQVKATPVKVKVAPKKKR